MKRRDIVPLKLVSLCFHLMLITVTSNSKTCFCSLTPRGVLPCMANRGIRRWAVVVYDFWPLCPKQST